MKIPDDWPRPQLGRLKAVSKNGWGQGRWFVVDHTGHVVTSSRYLFEAARAAHRGST